MSDELREEYRFEYNKTKPNRFASELSARGTPTSMGHVLIYPGEDGYWVAECPSLPGCISQAKTKEAAAQNIKEAVREYVAALEEGNLQT